MQQCHFETVYFLPLSFQDFVVFNRHREDEKMSQSLIHPLGLNLGPLDLESSALSTRPLLYCSIMSPKSKVLKFSLSNLLGFSEIVYVKKYT